jgi:hypothetical protein
MANPTIAELEAAKRAGVESAKPLDQLDEKAKRQRYLELRAKMGTSRLAVKGDPNMHYFWAANDGAGDHAEMMRLEGLGYSLVREPDAEAVMAGTKKPRVQANGLRQDGTYVVGDVILTQCSMETYEFIMLANSERHEELARGAQRDFQAEAASHAVPVFEHIK